jgi:hypothetical protein
VPPMKILEAATKWPADHFHLKDLGSIAAGKLADIDIVAADPAADIMNMRKLDMVIKDGKVIDRAYHGWYRGYMFSNDRTSYDQAPVSNLAFVNALKQLTARGQAAPKPYMTVMAPNGKEVGILPGVADIRKGPGLGPVPDYSLSPTPGIETIAPRTIIQGAAETTVTLTGVNFVKRSVVYINADAADDGRQRDEDQVRGAARQVGGGRKVACGGEESYAAGDNGVGRHLQHRAYPRAVRVHHDTGAQRRRMKIDGRGTAGRSCRLRCRDTPCRQ